jgi:hypothetical protein
VQCKHVCRILLAVAVLGVLLHLEGLCLLVYGRTHAMLGALLCPFCAAVVCAMQYMHMAEADILEQQTSETAQRTWGRGVIHPLDRRYRVWW